MRRPSRPTADDQSALPENRPESKTDTKEWAWLQARTSRYPRKGYAAFDAGDVETVLNDYDDNVEFVVPGNSAVSGTYRGKDGVKELFGKVAEQNFKITPTRFLADDDVVVVLSQVSVGGESGLQADEFTYREGRIVKAQNYGDSALFERVFGTK